MVKRVVVKLDVLDSWIPIKVAADPNIVSKGPVTETGVLVSV